MPSPMVISAYLSYMIAWFGRVDHSILFHLNQVILLLVSFLNSQDPLKLLKFLWWIFSSTLFLMFDYPLTWFGVLYFPQVMSSNNKVLCGTYMHTTQETWVQSLSGRSPGEGNGTPLQYSCLENPMDREASKLQSQGSQRVTEQLTLSHADVYYIQTHTHTDTSTHPQSWTFL